MNHLVTSSVLIFPKSLNIKESVCNLHMYSSHPTTLHLSAQTTAHTDSWSYGSQHRSPPPPPPPPKTTLGLPEERMVRKFPWSNTIQTAQPTTHRLRTCRQRSKVRRSLHVLCITVQQLLSEQNVMFVFLSLQSSRFMIRNKTDLFPLQLTLHMNITCFFLLYAGYVLITSLLFCLFMTTLKNNNIDLICCVFLP